MKKTFCDVCGDQAAVEAAVTVTVVQIGLTTPRFALDLCSGHADPIVTQVRRAIRKSQAPDRSQHQGDRDENADAGA